MKFKTKKTSELLNPIFIVGINPGKQRREFKTKIVWEGNKSGDYINNLIKSIPNLYLTNICNFSKLNNKNIYKGLLKLTYDILYYSPIKIVCLGNIPTYCCSKINILDIKIVSLKHPSYILRFNKNKRQYEQKLLRELRTNP